MQEKGDCRGNLNTSGEKKKKFYQVLILTKHNDGQILEHSNHKSYKKRERKYMSL